MKLDKRIEEAVPAGQQLQELGMRLRCLDDGNSDQVIKLKKTLKFTKFSPALMLNFDYRKICLTMTIDYYLIDRRTN